MTTIGPRGEPLAALIHDERLLGQRSLLEAAGSAARLALENTRLQAELRAQLAELRASRARIVGAADAERRRLERDLHDGAQQRLLALGLALQLLRDGNGDQELLAQAEAELQTALRELRDLARGIHPTILSEQGLGPAVRSLADRAPVPVQVEAVDERYPARGRDDGLLRDRGGAGERRQARPGPFRRGLARARERELLVDVSDDGRGGAVARPGGGLQGLARQGRRRRRHADDRQRCGRRDRLHAEIPCDS